MEQSRKKFLKNMFVGAASVPSILTVGDQAQSSLDEAETFTIKMQDNLSIISYSPVISEKQVTCPTTL